MSISKYCRVAGINIIHVSKMSGKSLDELNEMYINSVWEFEKFANSQNGELEKLLDEW